jgi:hypothetical protein
MSTVCRRHYSVGRKSFRNSADTEECCVSVISNDISLIDFLCVCVEKGPAAEATDAPQP